MLEGAPFVGAQYTLYPTLRRDGTLSTQPLSFGDVWNTVAVLMNCKVTSVAKNNSIRVFAFAIVANCAGGILRRERLVKFGNSLHLREEGWLSGMKRYRMKGTNKVEPLFLKAINDNFERLRRNAFVLIPVPFIVYRSEPFVV